MSRQQPSEKLLSAPQHAIKDKVCKLPIQPDHMVDGLLS